MSAERDTTAGDEFGRSSAEGNNQGMETTLISEGISVEDYYAQNPPIEYIDLSPGSPAYLELIEKGVESIISAPQPIKEGESPLTEQS